MATKRVRQLSTIAGALLVLLAAPGAFAQCPKYRIVNLGSLGTNEQSEAWAINDMGQIVGQSNTDVFGVVHAFFWDNTGCVGNCMKDLLTLPGGTVSIAHDVNNSSKIVGESNAVIQGVAVTRATTLSSGDSLAWNEFAFPPVRDLAEPHTFGDGRGQARDVNNLDQLVGWGRQQGMLCHDRALFWPSVASVPEDLHHLVELPEGQESVAEALNDRAMVEVVGTYVALPGSAAARACLWTRQGPQQYTFADLTNEINVDCLGAQRWEKLLEARDVNESGWIVGKGLLTGTGARGILLIPIATCLWDIGGSGLIDVQDLLFLLATWGPCNPPNGICLADFDCSGDVGQTDLNELLARWNMTCSQLCGGSAAAAGGSSETSAADFEWTIMMLGFSSVEEFSE